MAQDTITQKQANELTLDRESGSLVADTPAFTVGAGAALASAATAQKKIDSTTVNTSPAEKQSNAVDLTVVDNITGATMNITGTGTVGLNNEDAIITQKLGTKSLALLLLMQQNKITSVAQAQKMSESLINGDVATQAALLGIDFDSDRFEFAEKLLKGITNDTRGFKAGRQQFTKSKV